MLPIERMLEKVRLIAKNPLAVAQGDDADMAGIYTMMHKTQLDYTLTYFTVY